MKIPKLDEKYSRIISLVVSGVGALTIIILAASLSNLEFSSGQNLLYDINEPGFPKNFLEYSDMLVSFFLSSIVILIPLAIILLVYSTEAREILKRNLKGTFIFLAFLLLARYFGMKFGGKGISNGLTTGDSTAPNSIDISQSLRGNIGEIEPYTPPDFAGWQGYIIGLIIFILLGLLIFFLWDRNRSKGKDLGIIASETIEEIRAGRRWEDAVIECYSQMSIAVSKKRKLDRKKSMTPNEFAQILISTGLPEKPVLALTRLFEKARYSPRSSQSNETNEAIQCLTQIKQALDVIE